jgi:hypothetical protein
VVQKLGLVRWPSLSGRGTDAFDFKGAALSPQAAVPDCNPPELVDDPTAPQFRDAAGKIIE